MAFATADDVRRRLVRDSLTAAETEAIGLLLDLATGVIEAAAGKTEEAMEGVVPTTVRGICVELVVRAFANPTGIASHTETLGAYTHSETFKRDASSALVLTGAEELIISRAVWGTNAGSSRSTQNQIEDVLEDINGEADEE